MQSAGVSEFVLVFSRAIFDHAVKTSIRSLEIVSLAKMCFQWTENTLRERESCKCHIYAFFKELFLHDFLQISVLFLHMQQRTTVPKEPETDAPF